MKILDANFYPWKYISQVTYRITYIFVIFDIKRL